MGQIDFQTYRKLMQEQGNDGNTQKQYSGRSRSVGYFSLKDDGNSAIVRFLVDDINDVPVYAVHRVSINGKMRAVSCIREPKDPVDKCPLCSSEKQLQYRIYVPMLEYVTDEHNNVQVYARIWERPASYSGKLSSLISEYGPLSDNVFKIVRNGRAGERGTTYTEMYCKPEIYKESIFKKDADAFKDFNVENSMILTLSVQEMLEVLNGETPERLKPRERVDGGSSYAEQPVQPKATYVEPKVEPVAQTYSEEPKQQTYTYGAEQTARTAPQPQTTFAGTEQAVRPRRYYN